MIECGCPTWWFPPDRRATLRKFPHNYMGVLRHHWSCPKSKTVESANVRCARCGMTPDEAGFGLGSMRGKIDCRAWLGHPLVHDFQEDAFGLGRNKWIPGSDPNGI